MTASLTLHTWITAGAYLGAGLIGALALRMVLTKLHSKAGNTKWRAVMTSFVRTVVPWCAAVSFAWSAVIALPINAGYHRDADHMLIATIVVVISIGTAKVAGEARPDSAWGQTNRPRSKRFTNRHRPSPLHHRILIRWPLIQSVRISKMPTVRTSSLLFTKM